MKNLYFSLTLNRRYGMGLSFSTHRGSSVCIKPGATEIIPIKDDETLTDEELLAFYAKYAGEGLTTKIYTNPPTVSIVTPDIEIPVVSTVVDTAADTSSTAPAEASTVTPITTPTVDALASTDETSPVDETVTEETADSDATIDATTPVSTWEFSAMRAFVAKNNIEFEGRSKADYITAIEKFLAKEE